MKSDSKRSVARIVLKNLPGKENDDDNTITITPINYINKVEGENLEKVCDAFLAKGTHKFVIDFSGTDIINSIGISILIGIIEKIKG